MSATAGVVSAVDRVARAYERIAKLERPEVWIHLRERSRALADARAIDRRVQEGDALALAGTTVAVKDNIDVVGLPTTAGCPAYAYTPGADSPSVARLKAAGAVVLGKTNLDQFATGLVGARSPYGAVRDARDPSRVSGGSSSGSAVAVALEMVDVALGTDTAGSGRVPAAFQGIVGLKQTRGLVPASGVVPACRSFDCVSLFARDLASCELALAMIAGPDAGDPLSRDWPHDAPLAAPPQPRVAVVASGAQLELLSRGYANAYAGATELLRARGMEPVEIDISTLLEAGAMLYGGAFVAERYAAVGRFIAAHPDAIDPSVKEIILGARAITADCYLADMQRLDELSAAARATLRGVDGLMLPTAPFQPTIEQVTANPLELNRQLGTYVSFCNLLDMCAVAVPAGEADGGCFGVTLFAPAFHDRVVADLAWRLTGSGTVSGCGSADAAGPVGGPPAIQLLVLGAHVSGEPLNPELTSRGGRLLRGVRTAPSYRLYRLATAPPKPGLVRSDCSIPDCASIDGELWALPPAGLASLLAELPSPMALGRVALEDGSEVVGFLCEPAALEGAQDITAYGSWRAYRHTVR